MHPVVCVMQYKTVTESENKSFDIQLTTKNSYST